MAPSATSVSDLARLAYRFIDMNQNSQTRHGQIINASAAIHAGVQIAEKLPAGPRRDRLRTVLRNKCQEILDELRGTDFDYDDLFEDDLSRLNRIPG